MGFLPEELRTLQGRKVPVIPLSSASYLYCSLSQHHSCCMLSHKEHDGPPTPNPQEEGNECRSELVASLL